MKTAHSHKFLLLIAVITVAVVFGVSGSMNYVIDSSIERMEAAYNAIRTAEFSKSRDDNFLKTYQSTGSKWARLPEFFIGEKDIVNFIESVEDLGKISKSKIILSGIDADKMDEVATGTEGILRATVSAEGSWQSVMHTLSLAETMPYKITIDNVRLEKPADKVKPLWNLSFDIRAGMIAR